MRERFEAAAVRMMKGWKYRPADLEAGEADDMTLLESITFCTGARCDPRGKWWSVGSASNANRVPWLPVDKQHFEVEDLREGQSIALDSDIKLQTAVVGMTL